MRLNRRWFLIGGGAAVAAAVVGQRVLSRPKASDDVLPIEVTGIPIDHLSKADPGRSRFGDLMFRSGLDLRSPERRFGGFSSLWRSPDGQRIVSVADNAQWLTAQVQTSDGRLSGLTDAKLAPIISGTGWPLRDTWSYDTESLTIADGIAYIGIERRHAVMQFDWGRQGVAARARPLPLPDALREKIEDLPNNRGLEAIGVAPPGSPLAGAVIAIAERAHQYDRPTEGFILTGPQRGEFSVRLSGGYEISDMAFLPGGDLLLLERQFSLFDGFRIRIRRVEGDMVRLGAQLDGRTIFESDSSLHTDNLEGLAVHREAGETVLTLISDDNFNPLQRTLFLEFSLVA